MRRFRNMPELVATARLQAQTGTYNGLYTAANQQLIERCKFHYRHAPDLGARLIFTRDENMHSVGWWKNPDYERCYHLSLSFIGITVPPTAIGQDHKRAQVWCELFFGEHIRKLWVEPPFSDHGKQQDVYHYRLFMEPDWKTPLLPRGEVYSREFTEAGWKSWSDQHPESELLDPREQP